MSLNLLFGVIRVRIFFVYLALNFLSSCGGVNNESSDNKNASATELEGTWVSSCSDEANGMFGGHTRHRNVFTGLTCRLETEDFSEGDSNCKDENLVATTLGKCTFSLNGNKIDTTRTAVSILPNINGLASSTLESNCSELEFTKDVETDVSSCGFYPVPLKIYEVYQVEGNSLYFGLQTDDLDSTSAENRPVEIDSSNPFIKSN